MGKAVPTFGGLRREASAGRVESRRRQVKVEVIKRPSELGQVWVFEPKGIPS